MALPPVLAKQYGPFNGLTWIGVIGGGAVLAYFLRKAFSGGTRQAAQQTADTRSQLNLPGTTYHQDTSGPTSGTSGGTSGGQTTPKLPSQLPAPTMPKAPTPIDKPVLPAPGKVPSVTNVSPRSVAKSANLTISGKNLDVVTNVKIGQGGWSQIVSKTASQLVVKVDPGSTSGALRLYYLKNGVSTATVGLGVIVTAAPATTGGSTTPSPGTGGSTTPSPGTGDGSTTPSIPGGYAPGCSGVGPVPRDYAQRKAQSVSTYQNRSIKTAWAILNITGPAGSDVNALSRWLAVPGATATANGIRRSRGLQPLNENQWTAVRVDLANIIQRTGAKENKVTDQDIMGLWEKYNTPFLCANTPAQSGSRNNRLQ